MVGTRSREYSSHLKSVPNEFQTVPDGAAIDLPKFLSGLLVILCVGRTDCQGIDFDSEWMEPEAEAIPGFSKQVIINSKQFHMELQQIYSNSRLDSQCFYVGQRTGCQAVYSDSLWM